MNKGGTDLSLLSPRPRTLCELQTDNSTGTFFGDISGAANDDELAVLGVAHEMSKGRLFQVPLEEPRTFQNPP